MIHVVVACLVVCGLLSLASESSAQNIGVDWVDVGDAHNENDWTGWGAVPYEFKISRHEAVNSEYAAFLNAVAASDPMELYNEAMGSHAIVGGITRSGSDGSYTYSTIAGFEQKPVVFVSFWDAVRFVNWIHNGQPVGAQGAGTTEDGAYTLSQQAIDDNSVDRHPEGSVYLPSRDEWYKAAFYDPGLKDYHTYPMGAGQGECVAPAFDSGSSANCDNVVGDIGELTDVGAYGASPSPYGTFDQGGNADEWNDTRPTGFQRQVCGGSWDTFLSHLIANQNFGTLPWAENDNIGFRIVSAAVPEPGSLLMGGTCLLVLAWLRRDRTRA